MRIRPLPTVVRSDSTTRTQVHRDGQWAIYECIHDDVPGCPHWEAIKISTRPPSALDSHAEDWDRVERYPVSEDWGTRGWTCSTLEKAFDRVRMDTSRHQDARS